MSDPEGHLLTITDPSSGRGAGILAGVGGRLTLLREADGPNLLLAVPERWDLAAHPPPRPSASPRWVAYQGHIHWIAPQRDWWLDQDLDPGHVWDWPPDPWLIWGEYRVVERSKSDVELEGPSSPLCGLRLRKRFTWHAGVLHIACTATNVDRRARRWALWSNARFDPAMARPWVPQATAPTPSACGPVVIDGLWTLPSPGRIHPPARGGKWFLSGDYSVIGVGIADTLLRIDRQPVAASAVAPGQAPVEIFCAPTSSDREGLLEVEHHGVYRRLDPGTSVALHERWSLIPCRGATEDRSAGHIADALRPSSHGRV